jgi:hypothetical protein
MLSYTKAGSACNTIVAHLSASRRCTTADIRATGVTPVLALCRELLAAGLDPDAAVEVYRSGIVALRIRSIAEGAKLTVEDDRLGRPKFRRWRGPRNDGAAPPVAQSENSEPLILEGAGT